MLFAKVIISIGPFMKDHLETTHSDYLKMDGRSSWVRPLRPDQDIAELRELANLEQFLAMKGSSLHEQYHSLEYVLSKRIDIIADMTGTPVREILETKRGLETTLDAVEILIGARHFMEIGVLDHAQTHVRRAIELITETGGGAFVFFDADAKKN